MAQGSSRGPKMGTALTVVLTAVGTATATALLVLGFCAEPGPNTSLPTLEAEASTTVPRATLAAARRALARHNFKDALRIAKRIPRDSHYGPEAVRVRDLARTELLDRYLTQFYQEMDRGNPALARERLFMARAMDPFNARVRAATSLALLQSQPKPR